LAFQIDTTILKLVIVPPFIAGVSLAGRRWGPSIGGWLIGLPMNAGVIVFFVAIEQGDVFAAQTAQGSLLGTVSLALFCLTYTRTVPSVGKWYWALAASWVVFFVATFGLEGVTLPVIVSFPVVAVLLAIVRVLMPKAGKQNTIKNSSGDYPRWDIPLRIVTATTLVFLLTVAASQLGPQLTGLLAPFPIYATVLTSFTHHLEGEMGAIRFLRGLAVGLYTFATFFLVLGVTIAPLGIAVSFGFALTVSLVVHFSSLWATRKREKVSH
jgi:hypothetical protein